MTAIDLYDRFVEFGWPTVTETDLNDYDLTGYEHQIAVIAINKLDEALELLKELID